MRRHHVPLGTKTNVGGEVITASSMRSLNGVKFAIEGDRIYCPACQSVGSIRCHGARLQDTWNGVSFALEHDLCICKCSPPPTLLAGQSLSFQTLDGSGFAANHDARGNSADSGGAPASAAPSGLPRPNDEQFRLVHPKTGAPLEGVAYRISGPSGVVRGRTDADGLSVRVATGNTGHTLRIEYFDEPEAAMPNPPLDPDEC